MELKTGILFVVLVAGCFAIPTPNANEDLSIFFDHADASRIVGGSVAPEGSAPHMVALSSGILVRSFSCGGSIISSRTVLTAAHCIAAAFSGGSLLGSYRGTVGTNRWNLGGSTFSFERNVTHANYVSATIKNDIGILITATEISFSTTIQPTTLNYDYVSGGVAVRATGWGRIRAGGALSTLLLELYMDTISGEQCVRAVEQAAADLNMRSPPVEPHIELCVFHSEGHGMCNGDSGSALVQIDQGTQVGIVSWGFPCALGAPDMFVRLSAYREFVQQHLV